MAMTGSADDQLALFPMAGKAVTDVRKLSADRQRTERQAARIRNGVHPLSGDIAGCFLTLHTEAAPGHDRTAPGRRCGNCTYRQVLGHHDRAYAKCTWPTGARNAPRVTNSAASDIRAWWPACRDHTYPPETTT